MTDNEIRAMWVYAFSAWPNYPPPDTAEVQSVRMQAWRDQLADLPIIHVRAGLVELGNREFFPPLGMVREAALDVARRERGEPAVPDPDQAWAEVMNGFHTVGSYGQPEWSHPAVASTVRAMDWQTMCMSTELEVMRGQFVKLYGLCRDRTVRESRPPAPALAAVLAGVGHRGELEAGE